MHIAHFMSIYIFIISIDADYDELVAPNKESFDASLQQQLAVALNTDTSSIQNLRTWAGSIEVSFNLVADNQVRTIFTKTHQIWSFWELMG